MIVGGYSLHLYCDLNQLRHGEVTDALGHTYKEFPHEYHEETGEECRQKARKQGWKLDLTRNMALCPRCVKAGRKLPPK